MKYHKKSSREPKKGFIYVASKSYIYYELGLRACQSLKDCFPDANVTLFTHEKFVDKRSDIFDNIIIDIPIHYRAKMWCMARTPYDKTVYIDVDSQVKRRKVKDMFNFLDDCDMFFGRPEPYTVADIKWSHMDKAMTIVPPYHGALCGYNKTDHTIDFLQTWYDEYIKQISTPWPYHEHHYPEWRNFDMFTLWRMTSKRFNEFDRFNDLNIKLIPDKYITTAQHATEDLVGAVIQQVDRTTWQRIPAFWSQVESKLELYSFDKSEINQVSPKFN